jgi:GNAT superfamily N-acetyltransferase
MSPEAPNIRIALIEDAEPIARVHLESRKTTYQAICPEILQNSSTVEEWVRRWRKILSTDEPTSITLVASDAHGGIVGFMSGGRERTGQLGCDGELYAAYLLEESQRRGLGTQLFQRFASELKAHGFASMAVWVLALNPSVKFYEALGGHIIGQQNIEGGGKVFVEIAYGWSDLTLLLLQKSTRSPINMTI